MIDLLTKRRSVRRFKKTKIEGDKIELLMKAALLSPSSRSRKPWEFVFVTKSDTLTELAKAKKHGSSFLGGAPLCIVVIADPSICDVWIEDASIASIIIQLASESVGLSSCWIQIRERAHTNDESSESFVRRTLDIPDAFKVLCMIAVGYADEEKKPTSDSELEQAKIHANIF
jgi:nitroreductase